MMMWMNKKTKKQEEIPEQSIDKGDFYLKVQTIYANHAKKFVSTEITRMNDEIIAAAEQGRNHFSQFYSENEKNIMDQISEYYLKQGFSTTALYHHLGGCRLTIEWGDESNE